MQNIFNSIFQEYIFARLCALFIWFLIDFLEQISILKVSTLGKEEEKRKTRAYDFTSDNCIFQVLFPFCISACAPLHHACLCSIQEPQENLTWKQTFLNRIHLPVSKGNKQFSPMLIFILSHIMYTENVSVNLRIMTVRPFLPSQYSSNAV